MRTRGVQVTEEPSPASDVRRRGGTGASRRTSTGKPVADTPVKEPHEDEEAEKRREEVGCQTACAVSVN
jgi:hypothetical protein